MSLNSPQKNLTNFLPPKSSTPKTCQKPADFENPQAFSVISPRNFSPQEKPAEGSKTPLKLSNSSPSHRRSGVILNSLPESKKFQEHIARIEEEKNRLKQDLEIQKNICLELQLKISVFASKIQKKNEKIQVLAFLLKETEAQFTENKDLGKIIKKQDLKIKELFDALAGQKKELSAEWENEKAELDKKISFLESMNAGKMKNQEEGFTETTERLEKMNEESNRKFCLKDREDDFKVICRLGGKVEFEIKRLKEIVEIIAKDGDVGLSKILMTPRFEKNACFDLPKVLQNSLLDLHVIRTSISDLYAEKLGQICKIQ